MTLWQNLRWKLVATIVLAVIVWLVSGMFGFPSIFRLYFGGYVLIALPFFVLLDLRFGTESRLGGWAMLLVFAIASIVLTLAAFMLPQYNPRVEQEKITRLQRSFLERQKPQRVETLRKEAAELGLAVVVPDAGASVGNTAQTPAGTPAAVPDAGASVGNATPPAVAATPTPGLVARGKQAYDDWECYNCHKIGGKGGVKRRGPELDNTGNLLSPDAIRAEILNPSSSLAEGSEEEYNKVTMPDDFGKRMSDDEIKAMVAYLSALKDTAVQTPRPLFPGTVKGDRGPFYEVPLEYQRTMPPGWWTDPKIIAEGKALYEGQVKSDVVCAACHGRDGTPVFTGAADFRNSDLVESWSDVYWFWRTAKGMPGTAMTAWEGKLTPDEILKVMAYINTFAYQGKPTDHDAKFYPPKAKVK